ncbi:MAG: class I SAM-dependent methyltransferase [Lysobacterales bacterium]
MSKVHDMMPDTLHDERARFAFVVDLKNHLERYGGPANTQLVNEKVRPGLTSETDPAKQLQKARQAIQEELPYQHWQTLMRAAQELMWDSVGDCVDRQYQSLEDKASSIANAPPVASEPSFQVPRYLTAVDTHLMPGSYYAQRSDIDVRQGAVFDLAAAIYHRGRNGKGLNDVRGHTVVSHLWERFPTLQPASILEMGCTVGHSAVAVASYFPEAQMHGVDVGLPVLRYARARAASLGVDIHLAQQNAEQLNYPDASFDVVYSSVMLHETSSKALPRIMAECYRVLRPGGVVIHLEVPARYKDLTLAEKLRGEYETYYNNEPFWRGACTADLTAALEKVGFDAVAEGYQQAVAQATRDHKPGFSTQRGPVYTCWYIASGRKPSDP